MKTKFLLIFCMVMFGIAANSQEKSLSVVVGVNPGFGTMNTKIKLDNEKYTIDYKMGFGISVDLEKQFKGVVSLSELRYAKWKFDEVDLYEGEKAIFPIGNTFDDASSISFMQYAGKTIFPNKRVQVPLYIGIGMDYILGEPYHNLYIDLGVKARVKAYITDNLGVFLGVDAKYGFGQSERGLPEKSNDYFMLSKMNYYADFGLTLNI